MIIFAFGGIMIITGIIALESHFITAQVTMKTPVLK